MPTVADEYRKQALECHKRAELTSKQEDRAFWLLLAQNWLKLAQEFDEISRFGLRDSSECYYDKKASETVG